YDAQGKQICCTQEAEIYTNAGTKHPVQDDDCCSIQKPDHEEQRDDDGHDHSHSGGTVGVFKMFQPALISLVLLLAGIAMDSWFTQTWFTDWVRLIWYVVAYIPVGLPVIKKAIQSIRK